MPYDIAIVGAGPAGATLARLLDKRYKVLLLDKRDLLDSEGEKRSKSCGGLLAPDAQEILGRLGLAVPTSVLVDPQLFLVRTIDFDNRLEQFYQRFYFNMDRKRFDEWLVSLIPAHVDIAFNCRFTSISESRDGYDIAFMHDKKIYTEKVSLIIGADGAMSQVRRQLFPNRCNQRLYISIQEWFETNEMMPYYCAIFDSAITDFYSWTIVKDGKLLIGSALHPDKQADAKFTALKEKLKRYGIAFGDRTKREGAYLARPMKGSDIVYGNDHAALIGEAACFISPSSAEGFSYAVKSALALSESLSHGIEGFQKRYRGNTASLRRNILLKKLKSPAMYQKTLRGFIMKSGLMSANLIK